MHVGLSLDGAHQQDWNGTAQQSKQASQQSQHSKPASTAKHSQPAQQASQHSKAQCRTWLCCEAAYGTVHAFFESNIEITEISIYIKRVGWLDCGYFVTEALYGP
jgi:hypothetical protein